MWPESGLVPVALAAYAPSIWTVISVSLTAVQLHDVFGTDDAGAIADQLATEQKDATVQKCAEAAGSDGGALSQSSRDYYRGQLANWKALGAKQLAGPKLASFRATVDKIDAMFAHPTDSQGMPLTLCHYYAATQVLERGRARRDARSDTGRSGASMVSARGHRRRRDLLLHAKVSR